MDTNQKNAAPLDGALAESAAAMKDAREIAENVARTWTPAQLARATARETDGPRTVYRFPREDYAAGAFAVALVIDRAPTGYNTAPAPGAFAFVAAVRRSGATWRAVARMDERAADFLATFHA